MNALRLLLVTDCVGGVWVYSLELARSLRALGIEVVLAVVGPAAEAQQYDEAVGFRLVNTGLPLEWLDTDEIAIMRASRSLAQLARDEQADVVQVSSASLLASGDFLQPCVAVQHSCVATWWEAVKGTPLPDAFEWRTRLVETGLQHADAVVAPTIAFAAETARIYDVAVQPVHNGRSRLSCRDIPQGEFVFTAGRLWDEGKNITTLDRAAALLNLPFQAAGSCDGPNGTHVELKSIAALGQLSETRLAALFGARPIYASAALYEPFGLSVLEAAQAGCALVLSNLPTHREIWDGAAIFVDPRDDHAFATAIGDLVADPDERARLGRLSAARAAHFTPARMARGMSDIYAQLAARAGHSHALAGAA